jgi:hypothetical protein
MTGTASGAFTKVRAKKETTFGVFAGASGAQELRRTTCDIDFDADNFTSSEIRTDQQNAINRQGMRKVAGNLNGELSPGSYAPYIGSVLAKDFATGPTKTATTIGASDTAPQLTDSGNGFITAGFKVGQVITIAGFATSGNNGGRFILAGVAAGALTLLNLDGTTPTSIVDEAATASVTISAVGKISMIPLTGHTLDSYSVERYFSDIGVSSAFLGCRFASMDVNMQPTGLATIALAVMGRDVQNDDSEQFTSPTAASTSDGLAGVSGALLIDGAAVGLVTGLQLKADRQMQTAPVVGSKLTPDVWAGRYQVSGQFTAFFEDGTYRDAFKDETELGIVAVLTTGPEADADFVTFVMPRIKLNGAKVDDKESGGLIVTCPFTALLNTGGGTGTSSDKTTLSCQDSLA